MVQRKLDDPFRPTIPSLPQPLESLRALIHDCWAENPASRPDFTNINRRLTSSREKR